MNAIAWWEPLLWMAGGIFGAVVWNRFHKERLNRQLRHYRETEIELMRAVHELLPETAGWVYDGDPKRYVAWLSNRIRTLEIREVLIAANLKEWLEKIPDYYDRNADPMNVTLVEGIADEIEQKLYSRNRDSV